MSKSHAKAPGGGKKPKNTPPTKRRLGRVDEFFKSVPSSSRVQRRPASPSLGRLETSSDSRPGATTTTTAVTATTAVASASNTGTSGGVKVKGGGATLTTIGPVSEGSSDASYKYLRGMIDALKKENDTLRETAEELRTENEDLHAQVDLELPQLRQLIAERDGDVKRHEVEVKESHQVIERLKGALRDAAVDGDNWRRKESEHVVHADGERLGKMVVARGGVKNPFGESWQDGREWRKVQDELEDVKTEIIAVKRKVAKKVRRRQRQDNDSESTKGTKKGKVTDIVVEDDEEGMAVRKENRYIDDDDVEIDDDDESDNSDEGTFPTTSGDDDGGDGEDAPAISNEEEEEMLRVRLHSLRWRETILSDRLGQMERERDCLIRELRRQNDERVSMFGDNPTLHSRYVLLNLLGRGGFSEVFRAIDLENGQMVACKIHQLASNWAEDKKRNFIRHAMREYHIHKDLRHPRVVRMLNIFEIDDNSFGTVLQYCDGCDLDAYLRSRSLLPEREARSIIVQVFSGLHYLAEPSRRIIHYDLKPANILLCKGEAMITDFGLSKIMGDGETTRDGMELTSQGAGTMWYLPPECFEAASEARINSKVDVWSAGVILFQMLYGRKPFGHEQTQERMFREKTVQREELFFPDSPVISDLAKEFIRTCLTRRVAIRPDVKQILTHAFLRRSTSAK